MEFFGERFIELRNKNVNFIDIECTLEKIEYNNIKYLLQKIEPNSVTSTNGQFCFSYNREKVLKALYGDVEYFYTRMKVQEKTLIESFKTLSSDWAAVTAYYYSFFSATVLMRFFHMGCIYLEIDTVEKLKKTMDLYSIVSNFQKGNYEFKLENYTIASIDIVLKYVGSKGVHENTWETVNALFKNLESSKANKNSWEYKILKNFNIISKHFGTTYPSVIRNKINYNAKYGYEAIKNTLPKGYLELNETNIFKEIINFNTNKHTRDEINPNYSYYYGYYISKIVDILYEDLISRMKSIKDVRKIRQKYLDK